MEKNQNIHYLNYVRRGIGPTVKHFLFARTLFSRKFAREQRRENKVLANNSYVMVIEDNISKRENEVS